MPVLLVAVKDRFVARQINSILKECCSHLEMIQALSYEQCRVKMVSDKPEILILDRDLFKEQEREFFQCLEVIQSSYSEMKVIGLGKTDNEAEFIRKAFINGVLDYLLVPLTKERVREALVLALSKIHDESKQHFNSVYSEQLPKWVQPSLKSSFVYDFIFGNLTNAKEIYEKSKVLGLVRTPNVLMVVNIDNFSRISANKSELWKHSLRQEVYHVVQEAVKDTSQAILAIVGPYSMAIILALEELEHDTHCGKSISLILAEKIRTLVEAKTNVTVSVGVGNYLNDSRSLHLSFREVCSALNHKFFIGGNKVIHINEVEPYTSNLMNIEVGQDLVKAIKLGDKGSCNDCLAEIIKNVFSDMHTDPESLKIQAFEFLVVLVGAAREAGVDKKKLLSTEFQLGIDLRTQEVAEDLQKWMYHVIDDLAELVLEQHNQHNLKAVREAIHFIEQKYDQELTLEEIANSVFLSPNYFSSIFRKETGYTVSDYITKVRIEKAKVLLQNMENSVSDVGYKVGYRDPRYFCRVFKTIVGIPPSKYKSQ